MGFLVWKATTRVQPSLSKCNLSSAGVSAGRFLSELYSAARGKCRWLREGISLTSEIDEIVVLKTVDGLKLSTDVELLGGLVKVRDGGVLLVATENLLGLQSPVVRISMCIIQAPQSTS